jgi:glycosyltransferase involved in cell wall biosynthesis
MSRNSTISDPGKACPASAAPPPCHGSFAGPYVLVTPVKNEKATLGITIASVVAQTRRPAEWVIVDDGSTDGTLDIIDAAVAAHAWIRAVRRQPSPHRSFASVVHALNAGIAALECRDYRFIGILDADIRLQPAYYEGMLGEFARDPSLGLAGGAVIDVGQLNMDGVSTEEIAGAVQLFRRTCFEAMGGLYAVPEGGWDAITNAMARAKGFKTRTFREVKVDHLKPRNSGNGNLLQRRWQYGIRDYALGHGMAFQISRCAFRALEYPWLVGSALRFVSYLRCRLTRPPRAVPAHVLESMERERRARLWLLLTRGRRW